MKRLVLAGALLLAAALPTAAQNTDSLTIGTAERTASGIDTLRRINPKNSDLVQLRAGSEDGDVVMEVAGFKLTLGRTNTAQQIEQTKHRRGYVNICSNMEYGWTHLSGVSYDGYPAGTGDFLDQELWSSFHFSFTMVQLNLRLSHYKPHNKGWWFATGLQYTLDNIRLSDTSITLGREEGRIVPVTLEKEFRKSKVKYSSLGIPIRFTYTPMKKLSITATLYNDFLLETKAIYKKPKQMRSFSGMRGYQCGAGLAVSYHGFGFFVRQSLTPVFKSGSGVDAHSFSFGIACAF